ncbi:MAG: F0F1 ATP synthase subunit gamma [Lachnospiraceae bacterium]|nr:F0F1 ATP synthase subunit gamma [Lachnospiraceae bacterium]
MASAAEIRTRINSIAETRKVTDAMYMISSVKMRKAKREIERTKQYFDAIRLEIGEMLHYIPENDDRYFKINDPDGIQGRALLLITSDKGLSGNYNQMAIKAAQERIEKHPDTIMFIIGEYGRQYFNSRKFAQDSSGDNIKAGVNGIEKTGTEKNSPDKTNAIKNGISADSGPAVNEEGKVLLRQHVEIAKDFSYAAAFPTIWEARRICSELLEYYDGDIVDEIDIIYTHYKVGKSGECRTNCLLPLDRTTFYDGNEFELAAGKKYYPDPNTVLDGIVPSYLTGFIYSALVDSYCSEQEARMTAMNSAGKNADEMLKKLRIQYNGIRQAAITREMTEIAAGAKALKKKRGTDEEKIYPDRLFDEETGEEYGMVL